MSLDATFYGFASLAEAKAAWKEQLARVAMEYVEAGVIVDALLGGQAQAANIFSTDPSISANGFVTLADPKLTRGQTTSVMWQSTDGDWFELRPPLVDETGTMAASCALTYVTACRANWRYLDAAIGACATIDAVVALDLSTGWPSRACSAGGTAGDEYVLALYSPGKPDASEIIFAHTFTERVSFPANFAGSIWGCTADASASAVLTVKKNNATIASATYGGSPSSGVVSGMSATTFESGDKLTVHAPGSQDATLAGIDATLVGRF